MTHPLLNFFFDPFCNVRVYENIYLTVPETVKRTWKERLFTRPWRPFRKTKVIQVPNPDLIKTSVGLIGHPDTVAKLRKMLEKGGNDESSSGV
jgi:hypothetical protein